MSKGLSLSDKLVNPTRSANNTVISRRPLATTSAPGCASTCSRIRGSMYLPKVCFMRSLERNSFTKKLKESVSRPTSSAEPTGNSMLRFPCWTSRMALASDRTGLLSRFVISAATARPSKTVDVVAAIVNQNTRRSRCSVAFAAEPLHAAIFKFTNSR